MHLKKLKLIMLVLTPPIWVGCQILLAGVYIAAGVLSVRDRVREMSFDDRLFRGLFIIIVALAVIAFATQDTATIVHDTCMSGLTEWHCNVYGLRSALMIWGYLLVAWVMFSLSLIWQMIRIIWRYVRWVRYAQRYRTTTETVSQRTEHQRYLSQASR
jgi:hypothetical protein